MISIVIPVFNEGAPLIELCHRILRIVSSLSDCEIILVDDRSKDNSWQIMRDLARDNQQIKIARLCRNFGQHSALTAGLSLAKGKYIVMMDCDGQDAPESIPLLYETILTKDVQVVYAKRKNRKDGWFKSTASKFMNAILQWLSGMKHDPEIGTFRIMKRFVADTYLAMPERNRFIGGMFYWLNFESATVDVPHHNRKTGKSNYTFVKLIKLARLGVLSSSTKILSVGTYLGLVSSFLSIGIGIYYLVLKFFFNVPLGFTAIIVSIFFVGSIIMLLLGIIGEYLREIFEEVKARPNFIIEETINFD